MAGKRATSGRDEGTEAGRSPLQQQAATLVRPLEFAARDDFARADRVRGLSSTIVAGCERVCALAIPEDLVDAFGRLAEAWREAPEGEARAALIARSLEFLRGLTSASHADRRLADPVSVLPGIGPKRAEAFARRELGRVGDLLFHLPIRYDDRRSLEQVGDLDVGRRASFLAEVRSSRRTSSRIRGRYREVLEATVGDETGSIQLKWFRASDGLEAMLKPGARLLVTGDVKRHRFDKELVHPDVELVDGDDLDDEKLDALSGLRRIVPEYTAPEGVPPRTLRRVIELTVARYADLVGGHLPESLVAERGLPSPADALRALHAPESDGDIEAYRAAQSAAHARLILEELYLLELGLVLRRARTRERPGIAVPLEPARTAKLESGLPFVLTGAQRRVWREIQADLGRPHPMNRLVQGDVGSGKTAVAWLGAAALAGAGLQTALMAPTELLAEQHLRTLRSLAEQGAGPGPERIALLTASVPRPNAEAIRGALAQGDIDVVVGTHALVQPDVTFAALALCIVDEQHRFGVRQRAALAAKGQAGRVPHNLVMTATPIPRTLALTLYGDLDVSLIDELPPGRTPAETILLRDGEGRRVVELLNETLARGEQAYVVYPLVEESEKVDLRSALQSAERIRASFPQATVDVVHGRLDAADRGAAMRRFAAGETQLLVSTTVIEVGVDVPNATLMVVEHAERFGLAQLHQLRGRVGRGDRPGTCVLVSRGAASAGEARLRAMLETTDGFEIADADLRIRGPGEFLGTRQSGHLPDLRFADLLRDARLVPVARQAAIEALQRDPGLARSAELRAAVAQRWGDRLSLSGVG